MTIRRSAKEFILQRFPFAARNRFYTSRMFEAADGPAYYDDWWFQFPVGLIDETDFVVFAGAMDSNFKKFRVFKVPASYLRSNLDKMEVTSKGYAYLYIHLRSFEDLRKKAGISFKPFALN